MNLVILLNLSEYGFWQQQVEESFTPSTSVAREYFECIWILWKDRPYLVWKSDQGQSFENGEII